MNVDIVWLYVLVSVLSGCWLTSLLWTRVQIGMHEWKILGLESSLTNGYREQSLRTEQMRQSIKDCELQLQDLREKECATYTDRMDIGRQVNEQQKFLDAVKRDLDLEEVPEQPRTWRKRQA